MTVHFLPDWRFAMRKANQATVDANLDDVIKFLETEPQQPWAIVLPYPMAILDAAASRYMVGAWGETGDGVVRSQTMPALIGFYVYGESWAVADDGWVDVPLERYPVMQLRMIDEQFTELAAIPGSYQPSPFPTTWIKVFILTFYNERLALHNVRHEVREPFEPRALEMPDNPPLAAVLAFRDATLRLGQKLTYQELAEKTKGKYTAGYLRRKASERNSRGNKGHKKVTKSGTKEGHTA